jgi:hypothetical protein
MTEITAARIEALLRGEPTLDVDERRVAAVVAALRATTLPAPETVRARVRASVPAASRVRVPPLPMRRSLLVVVPAGIAAVLVAAVVTGIVRSGGSERVQPAPLERQGRATRPARAHAAARDNSGAFVLTGKPSSQSATVPVRPGGRLTDVQASLRLRVKNLDALGDATAQAQRIVRGLGGYVQSIDYTAPRGQPGNSYVELRVPVRRVQTALLRLTALGTVLEQQVSTRDLEAVLARQNEQIAALRRRIRRIELTLRTVLPPDVRLRLEFQLDDAKRALTARTGERTGTIREGSVAKVSLQLTTETRAGAVTPTERGRFDRAVRDSLGFLAAAGAIALEIAIALSPLLLLGAMWFAASRVRRRRDERRLLHATQ